MTNEQVVPVLLVGEKVLSQSLAIIEYLEEVFPEPALLPKYLFVTSLNAIVLIIEPLFVFNPSSFYSSTFLFLF